ncbi:MAG TPA: response regulator [Aggregatilineales bacterium]|nr:response regulator [Anaerolineales bacterium]HRE49119.1 response regulator [Aggregatilineales bacterium]
MTEPSRHPQILIVEDDADGQEVIRRILRHHHLEASFAHSAEEALERLSEHTYRVVILDLALPGMDGWTLFNRLQHDPTTKDIPCFAVTGFHAPDLALKALRSGFAGYFSKPLDMTAFVGEVRRVLLGGV